MYTDNIQKKRTIRSASLYLENLSRFLAKKKNLQQMMRKRRLTVSYST